MNSRRSSSAINFIPNSIPPSGVCSID
jgi:hypothetical protein